MSGYFPAAVTCAIIAGLLFHAGVYDWFIFSYFFAALTLCLFLNRTAKALNSIAVTLLALCLLQLAPTPPLVHAILSPALYAARETIGVSEGALPLAANFELSLRGWFLIFAVIGTIYLSTNYFSEHRGALLYKTLFVIGSVEAFLALLAYFFKHEEFLTFGRRVFTDSATGSFVNKNHFGLFMAALIPIGVYFTLHELRRISGKVVASNFLYRGISYGFMTFTMFMALMLSKSRGAFVSLAAGLFVLVASLPARRRRKYSLMIGSAAALTAATMLWIQDLGTIDRIQKNDTEWTGGRLELWANSLNLIRDYPLVGMGPGSFQNGIEKYNRYSALFNHPHNEYLAFAIDFGLPVGCVVICLLLALWINGFRMASDGESTLDKANAAMLTVFMVDFVVDFNLRIPVNSILFAVCCGYLFGKLIKPRWSSMPHRYVMIPCLAAGLALYTEPLVRPYASMAAEQKLALAPLDGELALRKAHASWQSGSIAEAEKFFDYAHSIAPHHDDIHRYSLLFYYDRYKTTGDRRYMDRIIGNLPDMRPMDCRQTGDLFSKLSTIKSEDFEELAIHIKTRCPSVAVELLILDGRPNLIASVLESSLAELSRNSNELSTVGELLFMYGHYDLMLYLFSEAKTIENEQICKEYSARGYMGLGDPETAARLYGELIQANPKPRYYISLADVYQETGDIKSVLNTLEDAAMLFPSDLKLRRRLADAYLDANMHDQSLRLYMSYVRETRDESAVVSLASIVKRLDEPERGAVKRELLEIFAYDPEVERILNSQ